MPKEKSINPAQAERKKEKAKAVKKGKAEIAARRNEKLARRNPSRLQKQLDDLKALESNGGKLTSHEQKVKDEIERDLKAVRKAREVLGDKAPAFQAGRGGFGGNEGERGRGVLGKRRRDGGDTESDESDVPDEIRSIPMPGDTPPPIPRDVMDKWYQARREKNGYPREGRQGPGTDANNTPLGETSRLPSRSNVSDIAPIVPKAEAKTVYEAAPAIRDLRKEAVSAFVPAAVRLKLERSKGKGGLVEPEEADRLEKEGYMGGAGGKSGEPRAVMMEEVYDEGD